MPTHPNGPIHYGTAFRDRKMYYFHPRHGIIVASQWPDMRAWRKTPKGRQWTHIRPEMRLEKTQEGWICYWTQREMRQRNRIGGFHIIGRLERSPYTQEAFAEEEAIEQMDMEGPCGGEGDDDVDSESARKRARLRKWHERNQRLQAEYLNPVPDAILEVISRFANRHWHLLNLVARCPGALDLVRSTPALALALSSPWVFREIPPSHPLRSARSLLGKPQTDIATWLGFHNAWSTVKILRKLPPGECTVVNLLHLRAILPTYLKRLQHVPVLSGTIIRLLAGERDRYRISPSFLQEIVAEPEKLKDTFGKVLRDSLWMRQHLGDGGIMTLRTTDQLNRIHDRLVDRMGREDLRIINPLFPAAQPFPPPPLVPASPYLVLEPLQTETELLAEGRIQKNCVGSYGPRVRHASLYVYRLIEPERATVAVGMSKSGKCRLDEIRSYQNGPVSAATLSAVLEWIECTNPESSFQFVETDSPF